MRARSHDARRTGFTLIELLAAVAIFGLIAALVAPNLGAVRERVLESQARQLAAELEFARARAVMTGAPHRMLFDADEAAYRLEWMKAEEEEEKEVWGEERRQREPGVGASPADDFPTYDVNGASPLPMAAPEQRRLEFRPVPGNAGNWHNLADELVFEGFQTDDGWLDSGEVYIAFERDGTTSYTEVQIADDGGKAVVLDVLPIAEAVRVRDEAI